MISQFYKLSGMLLRKLPPEMAHNLTIKALTLPLFPGQSKDDDPILGIRVWDKHFHNPIGLAAGFDKNARAFSTMLHLGFGFVEVGSVTPRPQIGNPKPRIFRLSQDRAIINRLGFNNEGLDKVVERLSRWRRQPGMPGIVGVNLGINKDSKDAPEEYAKGVRAFSRLADYLVINVSSPNTPGLRTLQDRKPLIDIINQVRRTRHAVMLRDSPPLLLKIAPDLSKQDIQDIAEVALETEIDGIIISNTTIVRRADLQNLQARSEVGGLSGKPLFNASTLLLRDMYRLTEGRIPLIGVGGISTGKDAYAKIIAGASLVQLYTALVYEGPGLVEQIKHELVECLSSNGFNNLKAAVGSDV